MLQAVDITWDTDGNEKLFQELPSTVDIPEEILDEDEISDYLSNKVGFCHDGFTLTSNVSEAIENIILIKADSLLISGVKGDEEEFEVEMEFNTPSDRNIQVKFCYNGTDRDFIEKFQKYADKFSVDEYVSDWLGKEKRQKRLIFNAVYDAYSIDAHWIKRTLTIIAKNLQNILANDVPQKTIPQAVTEKVPKTDQWNYVHEVGNPKKEGSYIVTLIYPEWWNGEKTGRQLATTDIRYFRDLGKRNIDCAMDGEPTDGLAWLEECGSIMGERVYAWQEMPPIAKLPDGVVLDEE